MVIPTVMGQVVLITCMVIFGFSLNRLAKLDLALSCIVAGVLGGLAIGLFELDSGIRAHNIHDLVFYVILPILVFESAWHIKPRYLKRWLSHVLMLSTFGMLLSCLVIATVLYVLMQSPSGFPWAAAFLTAAILAATDPVSVVNALKKQKASEELTALVESESLFNDAAAVVIFTIFLQQAVAMKFEFHLTHFLFTFFGGLLVGLFLALICAIFVLLLGVKSRTNILLVFLAFASFYIGEEIFEVSGILTVVSSAVVSRILLKEQENEALQEIAITYNWLGLYFTGLVFVLMGLTITFDMFKEMWIAMLFAIPASLIGRFCAVYGSCQLGSILGRKVPMGWQFILSWGGLRGVIAIVLVLGLPTSLPYWYVVQSMVFGVVLFSLLVQGTTAPFLIARYGKLDES